MRHQGRRPIGELVIELRSVLSPDLQQVPKTLGGDQDGPGTAPLQDGVGGHRGPVHEPPQRPGIHAHPAQTGEHTFCLIVRRRGHLRHPKAVFAEQHEVGERAPHVHTEHRVHGTQR